MDIQEDVLNPSCHICGAEIIVPELCIRCGKAFCDNHSSKIDPKFCDVCMSQVVIIDEKMTRVDEDFDDVKDEIIRRTESCRVIKFSGPDWVWNSRKIRTMSDEELKTVLEYHRGMVYSIEQEITTRKVQAQFKNYGAPSVTIKKTTEVKSKKTAKSKVVSGTALAEAMKKMFTKEQLQALFGGQP